MLRSLQDLERFTVSATDGDVGIVDDFLLDDERWVVRYLVVKTRGPIFLDGPSVLVSPISFRKVDWANRTFPLALTMEKVAGSPGVDAAQPVSRLHERAHFRYYGYPRYWDYQGNWGMGAYPDLLANGEWTEAPGDQARAAEEGTHLRSIRALHGYHIQGSDAAVGHLEDLIVDDETWEVRYLAIATSDWWFGRKTLIAPQWVRGVHWEGRQIQVGVSRRAIKGSPEWDGRMPIAREYEARLFDHHGLPAYWEGAGRVERGSPRPAETQPGK